MNYAFSLFFLENHCNGSKCYTFETKNIEKRSWKREKANISGHQKRQPISSLLICYLDEKAIYWFAIFALSFENPMFILVSKKINFYHQDSIPIPSKYYLLNSPKYPTTRNFSNLSSTERTFKKFLKHYVLFREHFITTIFIKDVKREPENSNEIATGWYCFEFLWNNHKKVSSPP